MVVGFPQGGDNVCVTKGVVSRIDRQPYSHGKMSLLAVQVDAAINSGNSGGPAFDVRGRCIGIAFQSLKHEDAENIGYIIPVPVVQREALTADLLIGRGGGRGALGILGRI